MSLAWQKSRIRVFQVVGLLFVIYFFISFIYALPGYTVKKMLGA